VQGFDQPLLWVTVALLAWGLVMVYSASIAMPDNPRSRATRHTHFLCAMRSPGDRLCGGAAGVPGAHGTWEKVAPWLFVRLLLLLVVVLIPACGQGASTARGAGCRWAS
jgi:cell division protein FtsW